MAETTTTTIDKAVARVCVQVQNTADDATEMYRVSAVASAWQKKYEVYLKDAQANPASNPAFPPKPGEVDQLDAIDARFDVDLVKVSELANETSDTELQETAAKGRSSDSANRSVAFVNAMILCDKRGHPIRMPTLPAS